MKSYVVDLDAIYEDLKRVFVTTKAAFRAIEEERSRLAKAPAERRQTPPSPKTIKNWGGKGASHQNLKSLELFLNRRPARRGRRRVELERWIIYRWALPKRPRCLVGRARGLEVFEERALGADDRPFCVLGPPGVGKSAFAQASVHRPRIAARFGLQRYFVNCREIQTTEALLARIAFELGIDDLGQGLRRIRQRLARGPSLLVLDNFETPWLAGGQDVVEQVRLLTAIDGLVLCLCIRGQAEPSLSLADPIRLDPLDVSSDAIEAFLHYAGGGSASVEIKDLVERTGGFPLVIELLARSMRESGRKAADLLREWEREGPVRIGAELDRSLQVTLNSEPLRSHPAATSLLRHMAWMSVATTEAQLAVFVGVAIAKDLDLLVRLGLAIRDNDDRVRLHPPIADHLGVTAALPEEKLVEACERSLVRLDAMLLNHSSVPEREASWPLLAQEASGIEQVLGHCIRSGQHRQRVDHCVTRLEAFACASGHIALQIFGDSADSSRDEARGALALTAANVAIARSAFAEAEARFRAAGAAFAEGAQGSERAMVRVGLARLSIVEGRFAEALEELEDCRRDLASSGNSAQAMRCLREIGFARRGLSQYDLAIAAQLEALDYAHLLGDSATAARCHEAVGDLLFESCDFAAARRHLTRALALVRGRLDMDCEGRVWHALGKLAIKQGALRVASRHFERARSCFVRTANAVGQANIEKRCGDIAAAREQYPVALEFYRSAGALYREVGSELGVANAERCIGEVFRASTEPLTHGVISRRLARSTNESGMHRGWPTARGHSESQ